MSWMRIAGIMIAAIGVLLVISHGNVQSLLTFRFGVVGDLLVLLSAPNWAVFSILSRRGLQKHPASTMMFYVMAVSYTVSSALAGIYVSMSMTFFLLLKTFP
ncbi:MAG: hypothetical protein V1799_18260 [bacterium]